MKHIASLLTCSAVALLCKELLMWNNNPFDLQEHALRATSRETGDVIQLVQIHVLHAEGFKQGQAGPQVPA